MNITIRDLTKIYGKNKTALSDINLSIGNGLFGLLGPNGAGKTTLMRILVTLLEPTSGSVTVNGMDLKRDRKKIRKLIGYLPQEFNTFPKVRTWEFLDYSGKLAGVKDSRLRAEKVEEYLNKVGLFDARDRFANKLSGGMKRRLGIAQAFIGEPAILIVDEPTTGLDPEERIRFRNLLSDMARGERIIILSTHIVGDISSTCNDLAIIHDGQLGFSGSPDVLIEQARGKTWRCEAGDAELEKIKLKHEIIATIPAENGWMVEFVSQRKPRFTAKEMEPTIEHAYVNFMQSRNLEIEEDGWTDE